MFWGLIMEPGRCYTQTVKNAFHVSMAALDISTSADKPSQVMCVYDGRNYLLCTLNKQNQVQCALDLNFEVGSKVSFATNGQAHVHLTGYLTEMDDFGELEEEQEPEFGYANVNNQLKRSKATASGPPEKKSKKDKKSTTTEITTLEEEEDSDDSDFDLSKAMMGDDDEALGDDEELDEELEEEEDDDEEISAEAGEEDLSSLSEDDDEVEEEEEVKQKVKPKQNGVVKKSPKQQQKQPLEKPQKQKKEEKKAQNQTPKTKRQTLKGGVVVEDLKEGSGEAVKPGKFVQVYYEGRLKDNNKLFDSTMKGPGFGFRLGKGEVIKGWDTGIAGMKVGGKRRIICPPGVAYGATGSAPVIPGNATLVFDVELKKVS